MIINNDRKRDDSYPSLFCSERRHVVADEYMFSLV